MIIFISELLWTEFFVTDINKEKIRVSEFTKQDKRTHSFYKSNIKPITKIHILGFILLITVIPSLHMKSKGILINQTVCHTEIPA